MGSILAVRKMQTITVILLVLVACEAISNSSLDEQWEEFKKSNRKTFRSFKDEAYRKSIFEETWNTIEDHNNRYQQGLETYELGVNRFADLTSAELSRYTNNLIVPEEEPEDLIRIFPNATMARAIVPASLDWRSKGKVTPVKNQGSCGSCWAFSTTGALESHYLIKYNKRVSLSEQQLVDCVTRSAGCKGGWMHFAYAYIAQNKGINYNVDYPYQARNNKCRYNGNKPKANIRSYVSISGSNEAFLKNIIATKGPVSAAIDAGGKFINYKQGVYYNPGCSTNRFTHAVVIVGYGRENGQDYWLVKNSWGAAWGQRGYIKMARNRRNNCGIAGATSYPVL